MRISRILLLLLTGVIASPVPLDQLPEKLARKSALKKGTDTIDKVCRVFTPMEIDDVFGTFLSDGKSGYSEIASQLQFQSRVRVGIQKKPSKFWDYTVTTNKADNYQLRVKKLNPKVLGIDVTKQYSGYLDELETDKHWFYWFFESRNNPEKDPVILWLSGGPGCSSLTSLLFELGPSFIDESLKPVHNPYSWNTNASIIFLDQPVNVGYSYSSSHVSSTKAAGKDVYAFLELFFQQFPEYIDKPLHIASESYGGHYAPAFADAILSHEDRSFQLASVLIGNGLTNPLLQYPKFEYMACSSSGGYKPVLSEDICLNMRSTLPKCLSLIEDCYKTESPESCVPATIYCNSGQIRPYQNTGRSVYDVRKMCEGETLCYKDLDYVSRYLNQTFVREALGAEVTRFDACNWNLFCDFLYTGDWMKPFHKEVAKVLEQRVPILLYSGDKDFVCNWLGNLDWCNALPWSGHQKFENANMISIIGDLGTEIGQVKNADIFTFARVFDGGHFVPHDQPEASLTMVNRWLSGDLNLGKLK